MSSPYSPSEEKVKADSYKGDIVATLEDGVGRNDVNAFDQRKGEELKHALLPRHMAMISIGGVIGTGLFLGTASSLHNAGPLGLWLGYLVMGSVCYAMMMCLGEMISYLPVPGGHIKLSERFVGKPLSFAMGWNYWYNWVIVLPAELSAAAVLMSYWSDANPAIWISVFLVLVVAINLLGTRAYGEAEFWFASIKIITIVGLIILSICIDLGVGKQGRLGFRYWKNPGPFVQYNKIEGSLGRFLGFFSVLVNAAFSFIGTEIVAIASAEAKNPRKSVPSAIRKVWIRICLFYFLGTFMIGLVCASNAPELTKGAKTASRSPFVVAINNAGIKALPSIVNAALVTSAVSAASSDLFTSSRALYSLAIAGSAPRIFARTTKRGLPYIAVAVSVAFSALSYMSVQAGASTVFGYFANMTSIAGMVTWFCIGIMYLRFNKAMKVQGMSRDVLPYKAALQPFCGWWTVCSTFIVMLFSGWSIFLKGNWSTSDFITNYIPIPFFIILYLGNWFYNRNNGAHIPASEVDLTTGLREILEAEEPEEKPTTVMGKVWHFIS
ncbi:amino acid permease [Moesziomyces antarcticus]|uniref:Amino acid permease n=2 Tax=Pseudozyma antarctica TaxID=84753 RepID=A0A081CL35_PSEA2|nr:amino acid permease [Moesziomyces antarcticus]GAK67381.1 amino acid permease [Moesziomyces antarcticus]SPO48630.1 probable general amino acid permease [Moesziomyces antarcticus]